MLLDLIIYTYLKISVFYLYISVFIPGVRPLTHTPLNLKTVRVLVCETNEIGLLGFYTQVPSMVYNVWVFIRITLTYFEIFLEIQQIKLAPVHISTIF